MGDLYKITELYKRGEKVFKSKAHRIGWNVYKKNGKGEYLLDKTLFEDKEK